MRSLRNIFTVIILSFVFGNVFSQQVPMYSQYIMNGFLINPSLAGNDGYTTINITARKQWVGMAGAPSTYAASFQTRILKDSYILKSTSVRKKIVKPTKGGKVGIGGYVFNDNNGIMKRTGVQLAYAYHISLGQSYQSSSSLSFGLALSAYQFSINTYGLIYNPDDPLLNTLDKSIFIPDFTFGTSFTTSRYYIGFAMSNLLRGSLLIADTSSTGRNELGHYFLTGGIKFPLAADWIFEPSVLFKSSDMFFKSFQADITSRIYFKNDYWAGVSWRTNDAVIMMVGLKYDHLYFAYAFDLTLNDIRLETYGSHEITLAFKFGENARRYRWLNAY